MKKLKMKNLRTMVYDQEYIPPLLPKHHRIKLEMRNGIMHVVLKIAVEGAQKAVIGRFVEETEEE